VPGFRDQCFLKRAGWLNISTDATNHPDALFASAPLVEPPLMITPPRGPTRARPDSLLFLSQQSAHGTQRMADVQRRGMPSTWGSVASTWGGVAGTGRQDGRGQY
jgi:hypothetical protein